MNMATKDGNQLWMAMVFLVLVLPLRQAKSLSNQSSHSVEAEVLLEFKGNITDGSNELSDWMIADTLPCNWTGVWCTSGVVTGLNLSALNVSGAMPVGLGRLKNLASLDVGYTDLGGTIPSDLFNCSNLKHLNLSYTYMEGVIPLEISNLHMLQTLDLSYSSFTGPIPEALGNLTSLQKLNLFAASFSGFLPSSLGKLRELRELHLGSANFTANEIPFWFANFTKLEVLMLSTMNLTSGPFPMWLAAMPNMRILDLSFCNLVGEIPEFLGVLLNLDTLFLNHNMLEGAIPEIFANLTQLLQLDLSENRLTGGVPRSLTLATSLTGVQLYSNHLSGELPSDLGNLKSLSQLDVAMNNLSGTVPVSITNLSSLSVLHLYQNKFEGPIPPGIANLVALTEFVIFTNRFTGEIPDNLGRSCKLVRFDVSTNLLSGSVPPNLCDGQVLQELEFFRNNFTGSISEAYGNCSTLTRVRFEYNAISGYVPDGVWGLPLVEIISIQNNQLEGVIPSSIGGAVHLGELQIQNNKFSGPLPRSIGNLAALHRLDVSGNRFGGGIPEELGELHQINELALGGNSFTGTVPPQLGNCRELNGLNLSRNEFVGGIPLEFGSLTNLLVLDLSHNRLSGGLPFVLSTLRLTTLDVSYNNLSGIVPLNLQQVANTHGNPYLCTTEKCIVYSDDPLRIHTAAHRTARVWAALAGIFTAGIIILVSVALCCFCRSYKPFNCCVQRRTFQGQDDVWHLTSFHRLTIRDYEVTNLKEVDLIGSGRSGRVYKSILADGQIVAVKKLGIGNDKHDHFQDSGFQAEVETLGKIRHRNIVKLLCCCSNEVSNLLVYEYLPNGSLGDILHSTKGGFLDWCMRFQIALGTAQGLEYLHHDCDPSITHRDVKSNNILLDSDYQAHIADFGLAKELEIASGSLESMSSVAGSYGYIAPEYAYTLKVGRKGDIYSFGVVLLELLTGKQPADPTFEEGEDLVKWVNKKLENNKEGIMDEILDRRAEKAKEDVNTWAKKQTHGKIENLLPLGSLDAQTRIVLANALYFKGMWSMPFEESETKEADFFLMDGGNNSVKEEKMNVVVFTGRVTNPLAEN